MTALSSGLIRSSRRKGDISKPPNSLDGVSNSDHVFQYQRPTVDQHLAFSDHDQYTFEADGVLKVATGARITYYSPGAW